MNIFVLHNDPVFNSKLLCNKHIISQTKESTQILCNCFDQNEVPYKRTHYNHPCSIWARESLFNYRWLFNYTYHLCKEYTYRYKKIHKCEGVLMSLGQPIIEDKGLTPFRLAMPDHYKSDNVVYSYQQYYLNDKLHFCKWPKERIPQFVIDHCNSYYIDVTDLYSK